MPICDAEIFASKMICGENVQSLEDEQMEFATSVSLNIEDLNSDFNTDVFQDAQKNSSDCARNI